MFTFQIQFHHARDYMVLILPPCAGTKSYRRAKQVKMTRLGHPQQMFQRSMLSLMRWMI